MSALAVEPDAPQGQGWDELVRSWENTDAPESCRVEIIEGIVTVSPPPSKDHNTTAARLQRQLYTVIPETWEIYQTQGVTIPGGNGLYIPDLVVFPLEAMEGPGNRVAAQEAQLVVEVTSQGNANHDRIKKARGYAHAGVPLYLLLDPWHSDVPTATLYGHPDNGTYRVLDAVEYGEKLTLPAPFDLVIETADFPVNN